LLAKLASLAGLDDTENSSDRIRKIQLRSCKLHINYACFLPHRFLAQHGHLLIAKQPGEGRGNGKCRSKWLREGWAEQISLSDRDGAETFSRPCIGAQWAFAEAKALEVSHLLQAPLQPNIKNIKPEHVCIYESSQAKILICEWCPMP